MPPNGITGMVDNQCIFVEGIEAGMEKRTDKRRTYKFTHNS